jgi:hypothetical protein
MAAKPVKIKKFRRKKRTKEEEQTLVGEFTTDVCSLQLYIHTYPLFSEFKHLLQRTMKAPTCTLVLFASLLSNSNGFIVNSANFATKVSSLAAKSDKTIEVPPNEFSRPLRTEAVLGGRRKDYTIEISAKEEELEALAKRFSLSKIKKLDANLSLSRDRVNGSPGVECIQVSGDILATVTQTCVRTNEDFEVDLEFSLLAIVKAFGLKEAEVDLGGLSQADIEGALNKGGGANRKKKKGRKEVSMRDSKQFLDDMRMKEIEDLLQDIDMENDIVEDESIFGLDGMLDVGELVAQTFRLKLDPYPKKPGTNPVSYSITG